MDELRACHPDIGLAITELDDDCSVTLAGHCENFTLTIQPGPGEIPARDVALIALWVNPFAMKKRRLLLAAGFTAYGTAAAASYLIHDIVDDRYRALRKHSGGVLPRLASLRTWPCFMVIEVKMIHDQVAEIRELAFAPLRDPGKPPWRVPATLPAPASARD